MRLSLHEVPTGVFHDFAAIAATEELAYTSPFNAFYEILRGDSLQDFTARQAASHVADPSSTWCYVVDDDTGLVAGAMQWNLHEEYINWKKVELKAEWISEGESIIL